LRKWVEDALGVGNCEFLNFYGVGSTLDPSTVELGSGYCQPPAAADVAIELLYEHCLKHPVDHVVIVPSLMTRGRFRKHALKPADVYLTVSWDFPSWHEPLLQFLI
jgi:hypothetical protein